MVQRAEQGGQERSRLAAELVSERVRRAIPTRDGAPQPPPTPPPARTYAEAATQVTTMPDRGKWKEKEAPAAPGYSTSAQAWERPTSPSVEGAHTTQAGTVVLRAAPTRYECCQIWRWIKGDNKGGVQVQGIRWLVGEHRRVGKLASSLVMYVKEKVDLSHGLRMGRKLFRTAEYDWDR